MCYPTLSPNFLWELGKMNVKMIVSCVSFFASTSSTLNLAFPGLAALNLKSKAKAAKKIIAPMIITLLVSISETIIMKLNLYYLYYLLFCIQSQLVTYFNQRVFNIIYISKIENIDFLMNTYQVTNALLE